MIYIAFMRILWRLSLKYWFDDLLIAIAVFAREALVVFIVYLTMAGGRTLNGWTYDQVIFLFSFVYLSYGVVVCFFTGIREFDDYIVSGSLDRFYVRPAGILLQIIGSKADYHASLGQGGLGICLFIYASHRLDIEWTSTSVAQLLIWMLSSIGIQVAIFIALSSLSFWFHRADQFRSLLFWNLRTLATYPITIYPQSIQLVIVYVVPLAFISYFPAREILHLPEISGYGWISVYTAPSVAVLLLIAANIFWARGLKRYDSSGSAHSANS